jgi:hypothetical protein
MWCSSKSAYLGAQNHLLSGICLPLIAADTPAVTLVQMRSPRDLEKTEYDDFFKSTFKEFMEPAAYSHFKTEVRKGAASWSSWTPSFVS